MCSLPMEKEANRPFQSHCLYITQLAAEELLLLVAVTSDPERFISVHCWLSSLNSVQWSWKWEKIKLLKVCSLNTEGNHRRYVETMHQLDPTLPSCLSFMVAMLARTLSTT